MKQFETFDPTAWVDGVLLDAPPIPPGTREPTVLASLAESARLFMGDWFVGPALAVGVGIATLASSSAGDNGWEYLNHFDRTSSESTIEASAIEPVDESQAWERAMTALERSGEDVDRLLARAAHNLSYWKRREAPFPTEALLEIEDS